MHDYSVRGHARERQIYLLAALAFSVMPLLTTLSGRVGVSISIGTATVFGVVFWLFDRVVWRWWLVRKALGFCDLNRNWNVTGQRLNTDCSVANDWTGQLTIVQTWSLISAVLNTERSISLSGPSSLTREEGI
jgi:hypothetical protein